MSNDPFLDALSDTKTVNQVTVSPSDSVDPFAAALSQNPSTAPLVTRSTPDLSSYFQTLKDTLKNIFPVASTVADAYQVVRTLL